MAGMDSLPVELFLSIMDNLRTGEKYRVALVCRSWSDAAIDALWSSADVAAKDLMATLAPLSRPSPYDRLITFKSMESPTDTQRQARFIHLASLVTSLLVHTRRPSPASLNYIISETGRPILCPNAKSLKIYLEHNGSWDGTGINALVGNLVTQITIPLYNSQKEADSILEKIGTACPKVSTLSTTILGFDRTHFGPFPHLKELICHAERIPEEVWRQLPQRHPLLRRVELANRQSFQHSVLGSPPTTPSLAQPFEWMSLQSLALRTLPADEFISSVLQVAVMPDLVELDVADIREGSNFHWDGTLQLRSPMLRRLALKGPELPKRNWQGFESLRSLSLTGTPDISGTGRFEMTDVEVADIGGCMPALETFKLRYLLRKGQNGMIGDLRVTPASLITLATHCGRLAKLTLITNAANFDLESVPLDSPRFTSLRTLSLILALGGSGEFGFARFIRELCPGLVKFKARGLGFTVLPSEWRPRPGQGYWNLGERLTGLEILVRRPS